MFRLGRYQGDIGLHGGTEEFLAIESPAVRYAISAGGFLKDGFHQIGCNIAPSLNLGQELRSDAVTPCGMLLPLLYPISKGGEQRFGLG